MTERQTRGLIALLLGGIGVHHFMVGNVFRGILYVVFSWTFIPAFIALIEGITLLSSKGETVE